MSRVQHEAPSSRREAEPPASIARALETILESAARASVHDVRLRAIFEGPLENVHGSLTAFFLQTAFALSLAPAEAGARDPAVVTRALSRGADCLRRVGVSSPAFVEPPLLAADGRLEAAFDVRARQAWMDALHEDGMVRSLGALHQELLGCELLRMRGEAVRLETGTWVLARTVLDAPPTVRAKRLQKLGGLPKHAVARHAAALASARTEAHVLEALAARGRHSTTFDAPTLVVSRGVARRRAGSHYTPEPLRHAVVARALGPLLDAGSGVLGLRVCDPSMGGGDFLVTVAEHLSARLDGDAGRTARSTLRAVITECLRGVDKDPVAVDIARITLSRLAAESDEELPDLSAHLRVGDALTCRMEKEERFTARASTDALDWRREFPEVFGGGRGGFDACVGNPPWVAYAGRAAQPLEPALFSYYERENAAFFGYRTLHGLFVRRAAELLAPGGRLGLVVPTSIADLAGYAPTRRAHDALMDVDQDLSDFGDGAFAEVFQPCMALTSTRRAQGEPSRDVSGGEWSIARNDLDATAAALLTRLSALPVLDPELFGERGFQTTGDDLSHLRRLESPEPPFIVPMREGTDVSEFSLNAPRFHLDPSRLEGRLRDPREFRAVSVLIRQTARYPIATLSDGLPFRNSILAGFTNAAWTAPALAAYLNSNLVRWYHFTRHRDARQGMPQLKIGHLRALPDVANVAARARLGALGERLATANGGIPATERADLDGVVFDAFGLSADERALVQRFVEENPLPVPRNAK